MNSNGPTALLVEQIQSESGLLTRIIAAAATVIVGQRQLIERILVSILANGHILVEGVPGLAKTTAVKTLAGLIDARFQRIQFV